MSTNTIPYFPPVPPLSGTEQVSLSKICPIGNHVVHVNVIFAWPATPHPRVFDCAVMRDG